jgi:hypothetical protein
LLARPSRRASSSRASWATTSKRPAAAAAARALASAPRLRRRLKQAPRGATPKPRVAWSRLASCPKGVFATIGDAWRGRVIRFESRQLQAIQLWRGRTIGCAPCPMAGHTRATTVARKAGRRPCPSQCQDCAGIAGPDKGPTGMTKRARVRLSADAERSTSLRGSPYRRAECAPARPLPAETLTARRRCGRLRPRRAHASRDSHHRAQERSQDRVERLIHSRPRTNRRGPTQSSMHPWPATPWTREPVRATSSRPSATAHKHKARERRALVPAQF